MPSTQKSYVLPMIIIGALFFIFGFVTWLNSVLIPFLKQACQLTDFQAYFVTFAFYISYFVMAIPGSAILKRTGFTRGMSIGLFTMAIGSIVFVPAAMLRSYPLFLLGLFGQGTGLTLLQTAANPYATILGPIESAAKRISIMGVCNKVAGMVGILILAKVLFSDAKELPNQLSLLSGAALEAELDLLAQRVIVPYIIMAIVLVGLALMILKSPLPEIDPDGDNASASDTSNSARSSVWQFPYLLLGVVAIFMYVGVEVIAIDSLALYGEYHGFDIGVSSKFAVYSLVALTIGYFVGVASIPKFISQQNALAYSAALSMLLIIVAVVTSGWISIGAIILVSFGHAFMWPAIWPLALDKLGRFTKLGSAMLIMGVVGGALLPLVYGAAADYSNRQVAFWVTIPCYVFIWFFAVRGHKLGTADA